MEKSKIIAVVGPTASGKTDLGIFLAENFNGEIVSADAMQIYKGMPIASAMPSIEERRGIEHHLMGICEQNESFSVVDFVERAKKVIEDILSKGKTPIIVGGTGLYINSLLDNVKFCEQDGDTSVREGLLKRAGKEGNLALYKELKEKDPDAAEKIEPNNIRRVIRALEVYITTGKRFSDYVKASLDEQSPYEATVIGITYSQREKLYERINRRVDIMAQNGLIKEAEKCRCISKENGAGQAIGHKEIYPFLDGEISLEAALENLKTATRHYAKRQLTWFRRREDINWIYADREDANFRAEEILLKEGFKKG